MRLRRIIATGLAAVGLVAAVPTGSTSAWTQPTLAQILLADSALDNSAGFDGFAYDFDIVTQALLGYPDLVSAASSPGDLTVFLPTDQAFRSLVHSLTGQWMSRERDVFNVVASLGADTVKTVLTYHIIAGARISYSQALAADGAQLTTLQGGTIEVDVQGWWLKRVVLVDKDPDLRNPKVILPNVRASNGIAHAIDFVLLPVNV
ncbi:MAG: hypothetical protein RJB65_2562 [Actinomycetota bacterium]